MKDRKIKLRFIILHIKQYKKYVMWYENQKSTEHEIIIVVYLGVRL